MINLKEQVYEVQGPLSRHSNQLLINYERQQKKCYQPGQTQLLKIFEGNFISIRMQHHQKKYMSKLTGKLTWPNGQLFSIGGQLAIRLMKHINNLTYSKLYFYIDQIGNVEFIYKINKQGSFNSLSQLHTQLSQIILKFQTLIELYGIYKPAKYSKKTYAKYAQSRINLLKLGLETKSKTVSIIKKIKNYTIPVEPSSMEDENQNNYEILNCIAEKQDEGIPQEIKAVDASQFNQSKKFDIQYQQFTFKKKYIQFLDKPTFQKQQQNFKQQKKLATHQNFLIKKSTKQGLPQKKIKRANQKLLRQTNIVKSIKNGNKYFLKYYFLQQKACFLNPQLMPSSIFMQKSGLPLSYFLDNNLFTFQQKISYFLEIILGVQALHQSGIVHRDLKPANILIEEAGLGKSEGKSRIKIIDFSDSALVSENYTPGLKNSLGYTLPYSPFECIYTCYFGFNKPEIDIWSLGILLHQLFYLSTPDIFSRMPKLKQFEQGIQSNEILLSPPTLCSKTNYLKILQQLVQMLLINSVTLSQKDRIRVQQFWEGVREIDKINIGIQGIIFNFANQARQKEKQRKWLRIGQIK